MTGRIERRTQSRKRPVSLVYVELPPANGGMMRDLSEHGFSLRAMMPLQLSEKVSFSFNLDATARIDGEAIVVRLEDGGQVAALEFAGLSAHSREQIRRYLDKFDQPQTRESGPVNAPVQENSTFEELRNEIRATERRPAPPRVKLPVPEPVAPEPQGGRETLSAEPPALLKLSAVRPEIVKPVLAKSIAPVEEPEPVEVEAHPIPEEPSEVHSEVPVAPPIEPPIIAAHSEASPELPPALEPLSALEMEMESAESAPGWMERFTLSRAIGIMFLLTIVAGSFVYHRELGHALVWLGQKIAGDETSGSTQPAATPRATATEAPQPDSGGNPNSTPANPVNPQVAASSSVSESTPSKGAEASSVPERAPAPQQSESALVPLTQVTRTPPASSPAPNASEAGQQEYQQAHAILQTPSRKSELPEAVKLLWSAVEKGNVAAEITLAELYRTGRGVSRNCIQAKILLGTAARKGSADAQRRLDELQREGCTE